MRENPADTKVLDAIGARLRADWPQYAIMKVTQPLVELALNYTDTFALRGYDSVQLAAARILREATSEELHFASVRARLQESAKVRGMLTFVQQACGSLARVLRVAFQARNI